MGRNTTLTTLKIQEINNLYKNGFTMAEIAEKLNIGHSTVNHYVWVPRHRGQSCKLEDKRRAFNGKKYIVEV